MENDRETTIQLLKDKVEKFCKERDWDKFHNAKDLATALIIESAELLEIFRWKNLDEVNEIFNNPKKLTEVREELADILYFVLRFSQKYNIDLTESLIEKLKKNQIRYPVEKFRGSNKKYNESD